MTKPLAARGLTALAQEAAELRAKYRDLPHQLAAVYTFEGLWDRFVERLRPLMQAMDGERWDPSDQRISGEVAAVDDLRLDLCSRQSTALPAYRDPLNTMLQTTVRMPNPTLYRLFGQQEEYEESGVVTLQVVSLERFDAQVAEGKTDIIRYRRELEDQIRHDGTRLHELEDALPRLVLATIRSLLWKTAWRRAVTTAGALLIAWLTLPVRPALADLWEWIRSLLHI